MENIFVEFLPPWIETGLQPAFYDKESGTVLQQTARMYARVNMLIRMFNKLSKQTKTEVENFEKSTTDTVNEYIDKFNELHDYVHDYFDNLDVQEEINNKLDAMLEDGTLQSIITAFLQSSAIWCYDNVADMKASTNLIDGSYTKTLGYYEINDGGAAYYKIVDDNSLVDNGGSIITLDNGLKAILSVGDTITPEMFGAYGDGATDDTSAIQMALAYKGNDYLKVIFSDDTYLAQGYIDLYSNTDIELNNATIADCYTGSAIGHHNGLCFRSAVANANTLGYGTTRNININGGTLDGGTSGLMFALLHGENIHFENIFFYNCFVGTHIIDFCGCKNVSIKNCQFEGNLITDSSSNYREMIQPDYANESSGSYWGVITGYDDLPTENLTIDNCSFKKGTGTYHPNAIGTHSRLSLPHKDITIKNCEFYDCTRSCIRLPIVDNVLITNNVFYDLTGARESLNIFAIDMNALSSEVYTNSSENITISNNEFLFKNNIGGNLNCIRISGLSTESLVKNITVSDNYSTSNFVSGSTGGDFIQISNCDNITVESNECYKNKHFIYKHIGSGLINSMIVVNNKLSYLREYISTATQSYSNDSYCNIEENGNIWTDDRGSVDLNNFKFIFSLGEDIPPGNSNANVTIKYESPTEFITVAEDGTIVVPNIFRNIKVRSYIGVSTTLSASDTETRLRLLNRAPDIDDYTWGFATTSTSKTINYPILYLDGKSDKIYSTGFWVRHIKWQPTTETIKADVPLKINTRVVIESY